MNLSRIVVWIATFLSALLACVCVCMCCVCMHVCVYVCMGHVAKWLEWECCDHATRVRIPIRSIQEFQFLIKWSWENEPSAWHLWKLPENHTTGRPKPCERNWVDETVQKPSVVVLTWSLKSSWLRVRAYWSCSNIYHASCSINHRLALWLLICEVYIIWKLCHYMSYSPLYNISCCIAP